MKKLFFTTTLCMLAVSITTAIADVYPASFWETDKKYIEAVEKNNYSDIVKYGTQELELMKDVPECKEKNDVMTTRYSKVGETYAKLKDYKNSSDIYKSLYAYASKLDSKYNDYVIMSKARINQYDPVFTMYTDGGTQTYYGAKNEKENGVLFGICSNSETRNEIPNESMILLYQELDEHLLAYNSEAIRRANSNNLAVEFALNCPNHADDIKNIKSKESYLKEISDMFAQCPNVPIYLRFGAEFDIWPKLTDAESFKTAFKFVSSYFKSRNPNVAVVWSPNYVSNWTINIDDFYPGDEYVDWVGMSLYAQRYFLGDKNQSEENEIVFKSGVNSDPVIMARDIIEKYGNKKPIIISEWGCGHKLVKTGENTTEFAKLRMKQFLSYLPMVYPQVKAMAYFDWYVTEDDEANDFRLSSNSELQNLFIKLTKGERFIQDKYSNSTNLCYRQITDNITVNSVFPVSCYVHNYDDETEKISYFIDDKCVGVSNEIPFTVHIDAKEYSGAHTLKAVAALKSGKTVSKEAPINIGSPSNHISVKISGKTITFDTEPIVYNDRTLVPMRKIFEELGAQVEWNGDTHTVYAKKDGKTIIITVGSNKMYINDEEIILDTPAIVLNDRTLVPVRAIAEGLDCKVEWDAETLTVLIEPAVSEWSGWLTELPAEAKGKAHEERKEYRRKIKQDGKWSDWSDWSEINAYIYYGYDNKDVKIEERTVYRYKK